ncbi:hypothetical protein ACFY8X_38995 [Streptomyces tanashiensis]|uniref:hypothetical protein n=1 Tax=Streptomyces tanashiensis TaxID=67367 RepID=UPI0036E865D9
MTELSEAQRVTRRQQAQAAIERGLRESVEDWATRSGLLRRPTFDFERAAAYAMDELGDLAAEILADGTMMRSLTIKDGVVTLELDEATEILKIFVASMRGVLDGYGAENYVETEMSAPSVSMDLRHGPDPRDSYTVTIQRRTGTTPHQFRVQAEERAEKAEANLLRSEKRRAELGDESLRRGRRILEYTDQVRALERRLEELQVQFGAELARADHAEADVKTLRAHLRYVLDYDGPGHAHAIPGHWDADGSPCDRCAALTAASAALDTHITPMETTAPAPAEQCQAHIEREPWRRCIMPARHLGHHADGDSLRWADSHATYPKETA